jgi:DNA-binding XRE family transcriptional regulator
MMPAQCALGMPRGRDRQPLTVEGSCESPSATDPVPPQASITSSHEYVMTNNIVRNMRTGQAFATCETTNARVSRTMGPMDTDFEIANRLIALREKLDLDQVKFAKSLGIEKNTYNAYERGKRQLTMETAKKIRKKYGISVDWLLFGDIGQPNYQFLLQIAPAVEPVKKPAAKKRSTG